MLFDLLEHKIQQQTAEPKPVTPKPAAKPSARNGRVPLPKHLPRADGVPSATGSFDLS